MAVWALVVMVIMMKKMLIVTEVMKIDLATFHESLSPYDRYWAEQFILIANENLSSTLGGKDSFIHLF